MKLTPVQIPAFKGTAEKKSNGNERYFVYLSKASVNDSLRLSKGREEQDGKFKFAQFVTGTVAVISGFTGLIKGINAKEAYNRCPQITSADPVKYTEKQLQNIKKFVKNSKIASIALCASAISATAALTLGRINYSLANKTANERGFLSDQDKYSAKKKEDAYQATEEIYDKNIK